MGYNKFFDNQIEKKLLDLNTAYIAKVINTNGNTAKVQPLGKIKQYGEDAQNQAVVSNVPIIYSARFKIAKQTVEIDGTEYDLATLKPIGAGDIVICVCCDRDISQAIKGKNTVPTIGHHSKSDSVIVGII